MDAAFEFFTKLGVPFYCFHDRDIAPEGSSFKESAALLDEMVDLAAEHQERTGVELLWGTANLFSNPRYQAGAATNPDPEVFAYAAAQVAHCLEATHRLGGHNYVLVGWARGLRDAAQHRPAARARPARPLPDDGRRAQAAHRVHGHDPHRAQAVRADQAPVRLRRRRGARVPPAPRPRRRDQGQHRGQPRDAVRSRLRPRDRRRRQRRHLRVRSTPTPATTGWVGTSTASRSPWSR